MRFCAEGESIPPKMALTPRCRGGGGNGGGGGGGGGENNLSEELANEDEGANAANFEPLSDSCGESDMEGLDLSLFEPQVDAASWCDSRIHAGTLHILVHYCGKLREFHGNIRGVPELRARFYRITGISLRAIRISDFVAKSLRISYSGNDGGRKRTSRARARYCIRSG